MIDTLIEKKIQELPKNVRYAIRHFDWVEALQKIGKKHHLLIEDIGFLKREIMLSILGLISPEEFSRSLSKLPVPEDEIPELARDIQEYITFPLRKLEFSKEAMRADEEEKKEEPLSPDAIKKSLEEEGVILLDGEEESLSHEEHLLHEEEKREDVSQSEDVEEQNILGGATGKESGKNEDKENEEVGKMETSLDVGARSSTKREEPEDKDYIGVSAHRVPGYASVLRKKIIEKKERGLRDNSRISHQVFPPQKKEIPLHDKARERFLKQIGAI